MTLPARSIEYFRLITFPADGELPIYEILCDCGTVTHLCIEVGAPSEFAFTCGGCESAHWMTAVPS